MANEVETPAARRESPRANSRAALIDAAFEEFSTRGYEAATVAGIAERAGVTTGALYAHFSGKLQLLLETVGLMPVGDMVRNIADMAARPWSEAARIMSEQMAADPDPHTLLLLDVIVAARRDPAVAQILRQGLERYLKAMAESIQAGTALGFIDPAVPTDDLSRVLALLNLGSIVFAALGERLPRAEAFARLADQLLQSSGSGHVDHTVALLRVRSRAAALAEARGELAEAVVGAARDGHSLRQIGAAAGMSHERVRQLLQEESRGSCQGS